MARREGSSSHEKRKRKPPPQGAAFFWVKTCDCNKIGTIVDIYSAFDFLAFKASATAANASGVVGFYLAAGKTIPKNRAYLSTTSTGAPALDMNWGDETTGIVNVNRETITNNQYYTLDGRRVAEPTKGIYIINGKKVILK